MVESVQKIENAEGNPIDEDFEGTGVARRHKKQ